MTDAGLVVLAEIDKTSNEQFSSVICNPFFDPGLFQKASTYHRGIPAFSSTSRASSPWQPSPAGITHRR